MYSFEFIGRSNGVCSYSLFFNGEDIGTWCVEDKGDVGGAVSEEHIDTDGFCDLEDQIIAHAKAN